MSAMAKKKSGGLIYSTNSEYLNQYNQEVDDVTTLPPNQQRLHVRLERKGRGGKVVTLVEGFVGAQEDLANLGKKLKVSCGAGGSAKDGEIIIQGEFVDKVKNLLKEWGYKA